MQFILTILIALSMNACAEVKREAAPNPTGKLKQNSGCAYELKETKLCATIAWENPPSTEVTSSLFLLFQKPDADYSPLVEPATSLKVFLWMPDMGHGSRPTIIEKIAPGLYRVSRLEFMMPGEWEVHVELLDKDQSNKDVVRDRFKVNLKL